MSGRLKKNVALSQYTSWRVGGLAKYLYIPSDLDDLSLFLSSLSKNEPILFLGAGTNVLISDAGFDGTVIVTNNVLNCVEEASSQVEQRGHIVRVECGILNAQLSRFAAEHELQGLEFLAGIPGTIGGALAMNAGAHGAETWQYVVSVETINRFGKRFKRDAKDFQVGYRQVINPFGQEWFIAGYFLLKDGDRTAIFAKIRDLLEKRRQSQPLDVPNAGSVFRNPPGHFAAQLIERCGLKGFRIGGASVSKKHANFIVNDSQASADDIINLINYVETTVKSQTNIQLVREVKILGV